MIHKFTRVRDCYIRYNNISEFRAAEAFFIANGYSWEYPEGAEDSQVADSPHKTIVYSIHTGLYHHLREIKLKNVYLKEYFK